MEIKEIELELGKIDSMEWWEYRLGDREVTEGRWLVYSDGSKLEDGRVGGDGTGKAGEGLSLLELLVWEK